MKNRSMWHTWLCMVMLMILCAVPSYAVFSYGAGPWVQENIKQAAGGRIFAAAGNDSFHADDVMTYGALVSVLADYDSGSLAAKTVSVSEDGKGRAPVASWAAANSVVAGAFKTEFAPDQVVTREQLAVILVRYSNYRDLVLPRVREGTAFSDMDACADDTLDALYTVYRAGLLDITEGGAIRPGDVVTRTACAAILCRYADICSRTYELEEQAAIISHMGYSFDAPENTLDAYLLSDKKQYSYVETDVRFTRDNVPVLLHDETIDRTSNGSGAVSKLTYEQLKTYDFNAEKEGYSGIDIPTFQQFISLCAKNYMHAYIELKVSMSNQQIEELYNTVARYRMTKHVSWISFHYTNLERIRAMHPAAQLGYLHDYPDSDVIERTEKLKNGTNTVYLCAKYTQLTEELRAACLRAGVLLEIWTMDEKKTAVQQLNTSAQGITVDRLTVGDLYR